VLGGLKASAGQVELTPSQNSGMSQAPADARQRKVDAMFVWVQIPVCPVVASVRAGSQKLFWHSVSAGQNCTGSISRALPDATPGTSLGDACDVPPV